VGTAKTTNLIGPFCPATTTTSEDNAGVWLDGTALYQADGSCFHGKTINTGRAGGPGPKGMPPGFEEAAASLGVTTEALMKAMRDAGDRNADLSKVASQLDADESALRDALPKR